MILNKQVIVMRPLENAAGLTEQALRFKVGGVPQLLREGEAVRITLPGPLGFRVDQRFAAGIKGPAKVEIKRIK